MPSLSGSSRRKQARRRSRAPRAGSLQRSTASTTERSAKPFVSKLGSFPSSAARKRSSQGACVCGGGRLGLLDFLAAGSSGAPCDDRPAHRRRRRKRSSARAQTSRTRPARRHCAAAAYFAQRVQSESSLAESGPAPEALLAHDGRNSSRDELDGSLLASVTSQGLDRSRPSRRTTGATSRLPASSRSVTDGVLGRHEDGGGGAPERVVPAADRVRIQAQTTFPVRGTRRHGRLFARVRRGGRWGRGPTARLTVKTVMTMSVQYGRLPFAASRSDKCPGNQETETAARDAEYSYSHRRRSLIDRAAKASKNRTDSSSNVAPRDATRSRRCRSPKASPSSWRDSATRETERRLRDDAAAPEDG